MAEAVLVAAGRTPIGRAFRGSLVNERPDDLTAYVVGQVLEQIPELDPHMVEDLLVGCGQPAGEGGFNLARVVAVLAGLDDVPGVTVNRYCSSSLQTIRMAAHAIRAGEGDVFVAAGVETISRFGSGMSDIDDAANPLFDSARERSAKRLLEGAVVWEPPIGVPDIYIAMGQTAENVAQLEGVSRAQMDEFALRSQELAVAHQRSGFFAREIIPITRADGVVIDTDDGPRADTSIERLSSLAPVFRPDGTITAGNACPLNDGAAAVVVMSDVRARELGIRPRARIISSGVSGLNPEIMGLGPIEASRQALARAHLTMHDIDLVEINEAFAAQVLPSAKHLGIPLEKLNVRGGAIALGHPFGMTGARIMTTLLNSLEESGARYGLETMCVGGGQGMAMVIERLD
jgi:acetyl-CoA C-acetyltransferase